MAKKSNTENYTPIRKVIAEMPMDAQNELYLDVIHQMSCKLLTFKIVIAVLSIMTVYLVIMKAF